MSTFYLAEHHTFAVDGVWYLFHVEHLEAYRISAPLAKAVRDLGEQPELDDGQVEPALLEALDQLNLRLDASPALPQTKPANPEKAPITTIALNVAQLCNLDCIYCYGVGGEYGHKGYMKGGTAYQAVDFLVANAGDAEQLTICFFGGEPLLNFPLIKEVVAYATEKAETKGKRVAFTITTNGTRFDEETIDYLNEHDFGVVVSYDGDAEMQNKNRPFKGGKGSYDDIKARVERFLDSRGGRASGRATITGYNPDLQKVQRALLEIGFKAVQLTTVAMPNLEEMPAPPAGPFPVEEAASANVVEENDLYEALPVLNDRPTYHRTDVVMLQQPGSHLKQVHLRKILNSLERMARETIDLIKTRRPVYSSRFNDILKRLSTKKKKLYFCGGGRNYMSISNTGDVYPCHRFVGQEDMKLGNVAEGFDLTRRQPYIENYGLSHPKCSACWARYFCGGGCFHMSIEEHGSMHEPDDRWCQELRRSVELGIMIDDQLDDFDRHHLGLRKHARRNGLTAHPSGAMV